VKNQELPGPNVYRLIPINNTVANVMADQSSTWKPRH